MNKIMMAAVVAMVISAACAAEGLATIDDIRVDALVGSHWGQKTDTGYSNVGNPCFNYATPNEYPCGCCATPLAQLCRFWKYPSGIARGSALCTVDGESTLLEFGGSEYDYSKMPLTTAGASEAERIEIGSLTYDCAVAIHSMFSPSMTFAYGMYSFVQLRDVFGYRSAVGYVPEGMNGVTPTEAMKKAIMANLDARCPVIVTLRSSSRMTAHAALVDGYGYHGGKLYFHFNLGWCNVRGDDAWYELDKSVCHITDTETYEFDLIDGLVYNIFPELEGDVLSGRVLDENGNPKANAEVEASYSGGAATQVKTDANGIYAFILPGGRTYKVSCEGCSKSVNLPASVCAKRVVSKNVEGDIWEDPFNPTFTDAGTIGCSWGNDISLADPVTPSDLGPFNPAKAGKGEYPYSGAVYDESDNPVGVITVKFTKPTKKGVSKVSASLKLLDGKTYTLSASPVDVNDEASANVSGKVIKKLGTLDSLQIGKDGFKAEITGNDGKKLTAKTVDLVGLSEGTYVFNISGLPAVANGLPVITDLLPDGASVPVNARGKISLAKAAGVKYSKVKGSKPAVYNLVVDTEKGKTNLSGLKLTYTAKTSTVKGSFYIYTDNVEKHKVSKISFTVNGLVIGGKVVGTAICKKLGMTLPFSIE